MVSFERIVILHERLVLRVAERLLVNREDAKDAAQEVFIRLHRTLYRFDREKDLGPWVYRLAVNACRDLMRGSKREISLEAAGEVKVASQDPEPVTLVVLAVGLRRPALVLPRAAPPVARSAPVHPVGKEVDSEAATALASAAKRKLRACPIELSTMEENHLGEPC